MSSDLDISSLFLDLTKREMTDADAQRLRALRRSLPDPVAYSPSFVAQDILVHDALSRLEACVSEASSKITGNVTAQSERAVRALVEESVKRIHASSPDTSGVLKTVLIVAVIWTALVAGLSWLAICAAMERGHMLPPHLTEEATQKVRFAVALEERIGLGTVDWAMRNGGPDPSLERILQSLDDAGTERDPVWQISQLRACRAPGMVAYASQGRTRCRFDVVTR